MPTLFRRVAGVALVLGFAAAPATAPAATASPAPEFDKLALEARTTAKGDLRSRSALPKSQRSLLSLIDSAKADSSARPCDAVRALRQVRRRVVAAAPGRLTTLGRSVSTQLGPATLTAEAALLQRPATKACGGGAPAPSTGKAAITTTRSTPGGVLLDVRLPAADFVARGEGALRFPDVRMQGMEPSGAIGGPGVPTMPLLVAVPKGASVAVSVRSRGYQLAGVDAAPIQKPSISAPRAPDDPLFRAEPFRASTKAYARETPTPSRLVSVRKVPGTRDLDLALVRVSGAQAVPGKRTLRVATALDVQLTFKGATDGKFASTDIAGEFATPVAEFLAERVVNWQTVLDNLRPVQPKPLCGQEMMIITSPDLRTAADRLAAARTRAGVVSRVFEVGSGPGQIGTTTTAIRQAITGQVNANCAVRPSYILLLGDTGRVPTYTQATAYANNGNYTSFASDLPYTPFAFILPLGAVGRLPVSTVAQADAVVDKLVAYADTPPGDPLFYDRAAVAGYFQIKATDSTTKESRGYIQSSEEIRSRLVGAGRTVDRLYLAQAGADPKKLQDGTSLAASLQKPTFAWDADQADIAAAWNQGRFAIFHVDHGDQDGWSAPIFERSDVAALTNGALLPFIFSLNCLTGVYTNVNDLGFDIRAVLQAGGGAVGAFGPSQVTWGEMRETYPALLDAMYNGPFSSTQGWVALNARFATIMSGAATGAGWVLDNGRMWNFFGDPSLPFWANDTPRRFVAGEVSYAVAGSKVQVTASGATAAGTRVTIVNAAGQALARKTLPGAGTHELTLDGWAPATGLVAVRSRRGFVSDARAL